MDTPPPINEEEVFEVAAALPADEQAAYLDAACDGRPELRARMERLLAAHGKCEFMQVEMREMSAEIEGQLARLKPEEEGEHIGPYKLLQQIGEGGFGVVWMAEQARPVQRRVALKIIKMGMDTKEVIGRFEQERQALAMMDHPNIARVFDAGATEQGRPFFVMELVKGIPITQFCDEQQLGIRERLALFCDVCSAINHAHQKGIIHRDIKPSNVMVTLHGDKAVVKVIDFGIAKATLGRLTDKTLFTRFEQFIGTPEYMSPEQAALSGLDIDTRSDIYALGILLYELLTGKPPFDAKSLRSAGYDEMRRIIREVEPPKPSSRLSTVAGEERTTLAKARHIPPEKLRRMVEPDLDWIVMKAIEKDRTRRYETTNGLVLDIQRFLADEPVTARPPSAAYKFRKFARRNKATLGVAALIATVLVAATGISLRQAKLARDAASEAIEAKKDAIAKGAAERVAREESEAIGAFLTGVFQSPQPEREGWTITVAETLAAAAKKLETDLATQPARRAQLQSTLGATYRSVGLVREAIPLLEKARDYWLATFGPEHPSTLKAMVKLGSAYDGARRGEEAFKLLEKVVSLSRKALGPEHPDTLDAMSSLAVASFNAGHPDEVLKLNEEVLTLKRKVLGREHPDTLSAMNVLADYYDHIGRRDEALKLYEEVLSLRRKVHGPEHPDTLGAMLNLASSYRYNRRDEAITLNEEVLSLSHKVNGPEHPDTLSAMNNLALRYENVGRRDEALKLKEEVLSLRRKVNGSEHRHTLNAMNSLMISYDGIGRKNEANKLREEIQSTAVKAIPPLPQVRRAELSPLRTRADRQARASQWREAIADRARVLELDPSICWDWYLLAPLFLEVGDTDAYHKHRREMLEKFSATTDVPTMEQVVKASLLLPAEGAELETAGKLADATVTLGKRHRLFLYFQFTEGLAQYRRGQFREAVATQRDVISASTVLVLDVDAYAVLAMAHFRLGQFREARAVLAKGSEVAAALPPKLDGNDLGISWHDVLTAKLLLREASALLAPVLRDEGVSGPNHSDMPKANKRLAISDATASAKDEAKKLRDESRTLEEKAIPPLAKTRPGDVPALRKRAERRASDGHWREAIADTTRVLELDASNHWDWVALAALLLQVDDAVGYHKLRRETLEKFGATTDLPTMERIAKASLLLPAEKAELETAGKLADAAVKLGENSGYLLYYQFAEGLAQYRRGQFREAVATQREVIAGSGVPFLDAEAYAVLAMAHHRLGQAAEARFALAKGSANAAALPPKLDGNDWGVSWRDGIVVKLLLREASGLIAAPPEK